MDEWDFRLENPFFCFVYLLVFKRRSNIQTQSTVVTATIGMCQKASTFSNTVQWPKVNRDTCTCTNTRTHAHLQVCCSAEKCNALMAEPQRTYQLVSCCKEILRGYLHTSQSSSETVLDTCRINTLYCVESQGRSVRDSHSIQDSWPALPRLFREAWVDAGWVHKCECSVWTHISLLPREEGKGSAECWKLF